MFLLFSKNILYILGFFFCHYFVIYINVLPINAETYTFTREKKNSDWHVSVELMNPGQFKSVRLLKRFIVNE